jgi:Effector-associated domain 10
MLDNLGAIIERLLAKTLIDSDIQLLSQLLQNVSSQGTLQLGKFNLAVEEAKEFQVGDRYAGATPEQIRLIVRELLQEIGSLQPSSQNFTEGSESGTNDLTFKKVTLDPTTVELINTRLEIIIEIFETGYLSEVHYSELRRFKQQLQTFNNLNETLQNIAEHSDRLIQDAIAAMRLQLEALKLSGKTLTDAAQAKLSPAEQKCQQAETIIFQTFNNRLEDSRLGADWVGRNIEVMLNYACKAVLKQFPDLNASEQVFDDFKFSLKQFLEQVNFCLYWGTYEILDDPKIPLVLEIEHYQTAFQAMKGCISTRISSETINEIQACLDYLIERIQFI